MSVVSCCWCSPRSSSPRSITTHSVVPVISTIVASAWRGSTGTTDSVFAFQLPKAKRPVRNISSCAHSLSTEASGNLDTHPDTPFIFTNILAILLRRLSGFLASKFIAIAVPARGTRTSPVGQIRHNQPSAVDLSHSRALLFYSSDRGALGSLSRLITSFLFPLSRNTNSTEPRKCVTTTRP